MHHDPEGGAELRAFELGFRQPADPEVNPVDPLHRRGAVPVVDQRDVRVGRHEGRDLFRSVQKQIGIGLLEGFDHHIRQAVAGLEVGPVRIGRQTAHISHRFLDIGAVRGVQPGPDLVQRAQAKITATGHVEREQISTDTDQIVADGVDHMDVDRFPGLSDDPAKNRPGPDLLVAGLREIAVGVELFDRHREGAGIVRRVQEGIEQGHRPGRAICVQDIDSVADHGVADTIDRSRELVADACVDGRVVLIKPMPPRAADALVTKQLFSEFGEDDALVFRLVDDLGGLEQFLWRAHEPGCLKVGNVEFVVAGPDFVHRGQRDVLVGTAVPGDDMVQQVDEGVGVEQERIAFAHEVRHQRLDHQRVVGPVNDQTRIVVEQGLPAHRHGRAGKDGTGLDVVIQDLAQVRQQGEGGVGRVDIAPHQICPKTLGAVRGPQQLPHQVRRSVDLVLVDEGRGDVGMLRYPVGIPACNAGPGQVGGVVGAGTDPRSPDLHRTIATLRDEGQAVVEVLSEGHQEGVDVHSRGNLGPLGADDVGDGTRIKPVEHGVQRVCPRRLIQHAVVGVGQPQERLACGAKARQVDVVFHPGKITVADNGRDLFAGCERRSNAADQVLQIGHVACRQGHSAKADRGRGNDRIDNDRGIDNDRRIDRDQIEDRVWFRCRSQGWHGIDRSGEHHRMGRRGHGDRAVKVVGRRVGGRIGAHGQFDHVLGAQGADDGVIAAVRAEQDPVRRVERRDVDDVILRRSVDLDRVEEQARRGEVADRGDNVRARTRVDDDLLDVVKLGDHVGLGGAVARDHDLGIRIRDRPSAQEGKPGTCRVDAEGFGRVVAVDNEGVAQGPVRTAVDDIGAVSDRDAILLVGSRPDHRVVAVAGVDRVVALASGDHVTPGVAVDGVVAIQPVDPIRTGGAVERLGVVGPVQRHEVIVQDSGAGNGRPQNGKAGGACQLDLEDLARLIGRVALDRNRDGAGGLTRKDRQGAGRKDAADKVTRRCRSETRAGHRPVNRGILQQRGREGHREAVVGGARIALVEASGGKGHSPGDRHGRIGHEHVGDQRGRSGRQRDLGAGTAIGKRDLEVRDAVPGGLAVQNAILVAQLSGSPHDEGLARDVGIVEALTAAPRLVRIDACQIKNVVPASRSAEVGDRLAEGRIVANLCLAGKDEGINPRAARHAVDTGPASDPVVAAAAINRVVALKAQQRVVSGATDDDVVQRVARAGLAVVGALQRQVLKVGSKCDVEVARHNHRVAATTGGFDHEVGGLAQDIGVIAEAAFHRVQAQAAVEDVVKGGADKDVVAGIALQLETHVEAGIGQRGVDVDRGKTAPVGHGADARTDHDALHTREERRHAQNVGSGQDDVACLRVGDAQLVDPKSVALPEAEALVHQLELGQAPVKDVHVREVCGVFEDVDVIAMSAIHAFATKLVGTAGARDQDVMAAVAGQRVPATAAIKRVIAFATAQRVVNRADTDQRLHIKDAICVHDAVATIHDVVTGAAHHDVAIRAAIHRVIAVGTEHGVDAKLAAHRVIAGFAVEEVVLGRAVHRVVAVAAVKEVNAAAAIDGIVAVTGPHRVIAAKPEDRVGQRRPGNHLARIADPVGVQHAAGIDIVCAIAIEGGPDIAGTPDGCGDDIASGVEHLLCRRGGLQGVEVSNRLPLLLHVVHQHVFVRHREDVAIEVRGAGCPHHDVRQLDAFHVLDKELLGRDAAQIVEEVSVLQFQHLHGEDRVEGRAQHAADNFTLGKASHPGVDAVEVLVACGAHPGGVPVGGICRRLQPGHVFRLGSGVGADLQSIPLGQRPPGAKLGQDIIAGIGHDEVLDRRDLVRRRALEVVAEVCPACVHSERRLQCQGCHGLKRRPHFVERRQASVAATHNVQHGKIQRLTQQVVAERVGHLLVDPVADLGGAAIRQKSGGVARGIGLRGQEGRDQPAVDVDIDLVGKGARRRSGGRRAIQGDGHGIDANRDDREAAVQTRCLDAADGRINAGDGHRIADLQAMLGHRDGHGIAVEPDLRGIRYLAQPDRLGEHGVAKAVHRIGEFRRDPGIDQRIHTGETADIGAQLAHELVEHEVLVGHLVEQLGLLEQFLAGDLGGHVGQRIGPGPAPDGLCAREAVLALQKIDHAVVLVDEHFLHRGQADVLVQAAIAGNVMGLERGLVVDDRRAEAGVRRDAVVQVTAVPDGGVCQSRQAHAHVIEEGMLRRHQHEVGGQPIRCRVVDQRQDGRIIRQGGVLDIDDLARDLVQGNKLRHAIGIQDLLAVGAKGDQRNAHDVGIMQGDPDLQRIGLDLRPVGDACRVHDAIDADTGIDEQARGEIRNRGLGGEVAGRQLPGRFIHVLAQEHGAAVVGPIGLAEIDEGRGLVEAFGARRVQGEVVGTRL